MEPTVEQLEMNQGEQTSAYPNVNSQQDSMDISLRIQALEVAIKAGAVNDELLKRAEDIHAFIVKRT